VIRCLVFLLLIACAACSPSRAIAVSATEAGERAGTIARLATHIGSVSTEPEVVADAALARDVMETSNPATIREYIAAKRASDPVWEAAWKRTEEPKPCTTSHPLNP